MQFVITGVSSAVAKHYVSGIHTGKTFDYTKDIAQALVFPSEYDAVAAVQERNKAILPTAANDRFALLPVRHAVVEALI